MPSTPRPQHTSTTIPPVVLPVCNMSSRPILHLYQVSSKYSEEYSCYRAETRNQIQTQEGEITPEVKKAKAVILVCDMSSDPVLHYHQVSSKYSKGWSTYITDTKSIYNHFQIEQREIMPKVRKTELLFFYLTRHLILFYISTKYHQFSEGYSSYRADTKSISKTKQREITPKERKPELSLLYMMCHLMLFCISTKYHQNVLKDIKSAKHSTIKIFERVFQLQSGQLQK